MVAARSFSNERVRQGRTYDASRILVSCPHSESKLATNLSPDPSGRKRAGALKATAEPGLRRTRLARADRATDDKPAPSADSHTFVGTLLGGGDSAAARELGPFTSHDMVLRGFKAVNTGRFIRLFHHVDRDDVLNVLGVSERTVTRWESAGNKVVDAGLSDRALRLAQVSELAADVLGGREAAEKWLAKPAIGLDNRKPISLLQTSEGALLVKTYLHRMDHGVYA